MTKGLALPKFDGLILAGGRGRRLGLPHKPSVRVGDLSMIDIARAALRDAVSVTVVGEGYDIVESPPGGGPVAAIAAGLARVTQPVTVVLAADLPFVTSAFVNVLVAAAPSICVDDSGHPQYLLGVYLTSQLRQAMPATPGGAPMRQVFERLEATMIQPSDVPPPWWDCDTADELAQAREWHERS